MYYIGWQANTTGEDVAAKLKEHGAEDVIENPFPEFPEVTWTTHVDHDADIIKVLKQMLWYNDRSDLAIDQIAVEVQALLIKYGRQ